MNDEQDDLLKTGLGLPHDEPYLPPHMRDGMKLYLEHGVEPGGFMYAILTNDLRGAVGRADHVNRKFLSNIIMYCNMEIPSVAWGSVERVETWLAKKRREANE